MCAKPSASLSTITQEHAEEIMASEFDKARGDSCIGEAPLTTESAKTENLLDSAKIRKRKNFEEEATTPEWERTDHFKNEWLDQMKAHQRHIAPITTIEGNKNVRVWFEYIFDDENPQDSKYRCRLCYKYKEEANIQKKNTEAL